jgi:hypothetical protein
MKALRSHICRSKISKAARFVFVGLDGELDARQAIWLSSDGSAGASWCPPSFLRIGDHGDGGDRRMRGAVSRLAAAVAN